jgi:tetraacyldisaccharide 4'-kinase
MLPYGNLREDVSNMKRADVIIVTKSPTDISPAQLNPITEEINKAPHQNLFFTSVAYRTPKPLFKTTNLLSAPNFSRPNGTGVLLVTGIANPSPFKEFIQTIAGEVVHLQYPDHYNFKETDIEKISKSFNKLKSPVKYIITTEKDAVRLKDLANISLLQNSVYYFPIGIDFLNNAQNDFDKLIIEYVKKNKRNSWSF